MITPFNSKLMPWRIAQARKKMMEPMVISSDVFQTFCNVWATVYGANK